MPYPEMGIRSARKMIAILSREVWKGLTKKGYFSKDTKGTSIFERISILNSIQVEETVNAKALS